MIRVACAVWKNPAAFGILVRHLAWVACGLLAWSMPVLRAENKSVSPTPGPCVLLVGNSYTAPVLERLKSWDRKDGKPATWDGVIQGGAQLREHLRSGRVADCLGEPGRRWSAVVLQEQSQTPGFPDDQVRSIMDPAVRDLVAAIRQHQGPDVPVALYQTWPRRNGDKANLADDTREAQRERLRRTFDRVAREHRLLIVPVDEAWEVVERDHPGIELRAPDGSHPSAAGAYLAACVFELVLRPGRTAAPPANDLDAETAQTLFAVARRIVESPRAKPSDTPLSPTSPAPQPEPRKEPSP